MGLDWARRRVSGQEVNDGFIRPFHLASPTAVACDYTCCFAGRVTSSAWGLHVNE